eukprot:5956433-Prorocentrum_lima.AAC.1
MAGMKKLAAAHPKATTQLRTTPPSATKTGMASHHARKAAMASDNPEHGTPLMQVVTVEATKTQP